MTAVMALSGRRSKPELKGRPVTGAILNSSCSWSVELQRLNEVLVLTEDSKMEIPCLGRVTETEEGYQSNAIAVPVLNNEMCEFVIEGYDEDERKKDFHLAISNFLSIDRSVLIGAEAEIFKYYQTTLLNWAPGEYKGPKIESPTDVWQHIQLGCQPWVSRRPSGDEGIYVSLESNCDWDREHGLQIVFKNGLKISKVGPFDGWLSNADAYDDESLEDVIYAG